MPTSERLSFRLDAVHLDRGGPAGTDLQPGDLVYFNADHRHSGLRVWRTRRGLLASRTVPHDAYEPIGRAVSFSRTVD